MQKREDITKVMKNGNAETQRKADNKKLIKDGFQSEISKKKFRIADFVLDVVLFFAATLISGFIINYAQVEWKGLKILIELIIVVVVVVGAKERIKSR